MSKIKTLVQSLDATETQLTLVRICRALKQARLGIEITRLRSLKGGATESALIQLEKDIEEILGDDKYDGYVYRTQRNRYL